MDSHSFAQSSLSPTDFLNGLELTPSASGQPGPRSYKSRKYRPCDFCRARQVACKIDITPPCNLCSSHGRQCTFVERPKKKRRPNASTSNGEAGGSGTSGKLCAERQDLPDVFERMLITDTYLSSTSSYAAFRCLVDSVESRLHRTIQ